jgi:hypothetical protein
MLGQIQSSLYTIGTGVQELATTVKDIFGFSDSDASDEEDYESDGEGKRRFEWSRIKRNARERRRKRLLEGTAESGIDENEDDSENDGGESNNRPEIIPSIRDCDFEQFYSRYTGESQKVYCADILIAGDELEKDEKEFRETVAMLKSGPADFWKPCHGSLEGSKSQETGKKWIRRIRINSRVVLDILQYLRPNLQPIGSRSVIFCRPFQLLITAHEELKEQLASIKTRSAGGSAWGIGPQPSDLETANSGNRNDQVKKLVDDEHAIEELESFLAFMESRIMPDSRQYTDQAATPPRTIRYEDLWYLFRPGDFVFIPRDVSNSQSLRSSAFSQRIMRVVQTCLTSASPEQFIGLRSQARYAMTLHFIDYDGASFVPSLYCFSHISSFSGQKRVTELPVYPVSYLENDEVLTQAISDGTTYVDLVKRRYGFYSGWTRIFNPYGVQYAEGLPELQTTHTNSPEHIESDILVDFRETFNQFPSWSLPPSFGMLPPSGQDDSYGDIVRIGRSDTPILEWDDAGHTKQHYIDLCLITDQTELIEAKRFMEEDELGLFRLHTRKSPTGKFSALLPRRFFAYAVLERKFVPLDVRSVRSADLEANDKAFERLEINPKYKRLILALVKSHFDKVETEKRRNMEIETQDLIRGKGKGVVILLHGVPGVGKTATAEAVALKWKKPLFPITCGDLGYTAETLEKSLNEIFRLAHRWGCILLLDEADVFITQRERHDLKRNALVSGKAHKFGVKPNVLSYILTTNTAFLRVLEYYNGIMFLTTNRAGVLDEAVKSRVHLSLYYDHLTEEQTVSIFKQHIQRLRGIEKQRNPDENDQIMVLHKEVIQFARDHFHRRGNSQGSGASLGRWNGRQIRNAFLIASSLAHYDSDGEDDGEEKDELAETGRKKQKQLGRREFELVAQTTLMYDHYRQAVYSGKSDDHVAAEREERAMSSQPRSPTPDRLKKRSTGFG